MFSILYTVRDLLFRLQLRIKSSHKYTLDGSVASDSQKSNYVRAVASIIGDSREFRDFRRIHSYREILEHVDYKLGLRYLNSIGDLRNKLKIELNWDELRKNDDIGNPVKYKFELIGHISPTTLRYVNVGLQIKDLFGDSLTSVAEVGAGYGGQARILSELSSVKNYTIFDLPEVDALIGKYLSRYRLNFSVDFNNINEAVRKNWDLVISNYAFSELPSSLQLEYVEKIFLNSSRGFVIMNSGMSNITGRSEGKLLSKELLELIPGSSIIEEKPLTGPDNYLLIWGQENKHR